MQLVDVAHSLDHATYTDLEALRADYGWSDRNHRIFGRMFGLQSAALHPGRALADLLAISSEQLVARNPGLIGNVDQVYY